MENKFLSRVPEQGWSESAVTKIASLLSGNPWTEPFAYQLAPFGQWFPGHTVVSDDLQNLVTPYGPVSYEELKPWLDLS